MFDDGVLESEKVSSECRLERLRLEDEEVEGCRFLFKAWISSILASFSCTLLGELQVGGEVVDAVAHSLLLLV